MFENDYLMRMIMQLIEAIQRSINMARNNEDPAASAQMLEDAIGAATELDGGVLLSLSPDSIAEILEVSGTDPAVVEYVGRSLYLESTYLAQAGKMELATLRAEQALALGEAYDFSLDEELGAEEAMQAFLENERLSGSQSVSEN